MRAKVKTLKRHFHARKCCGWGKVAICQCEQLSVRAIVSAGNRQCRQSTVWTIVSADNCQCEQLSVRTIISEDNFWWTFVPSILFQDPSCGVTMVLSSKVWLWNLFLWLCLEKCKIYCFKDQRLNWIFSIQVL